jgi:hypothetical protein
MSKRYRDKRERYVMLRFWLLNSPAWQSRPASGTRPLHRDGQANNGRIAMTARDAAKLIGVSKDNGAPNEPVEAR